MNLPVIIFDLGGVLINIRYHRFIETLGLDHSVDEAKLLQMLTPDGHLYESGKISTKDFFTRLNQHFNMKYDEKQLHRAWYAILAEEIDGMRTLVEQLSQRQPLYLLSNTNELHFEYAKKKYPVLNLFKHHFVSYKIGAMKPSPQIYHHVVQFLRRKPEELFFCDDTEKNVVGARNIGIQSMQFTGVDTLKKTLGEIGFEVP